jgi:hypothetical protein
MPRMGSSGGGETLKPLVSIKKVVFGATQLRAGHPEHMIRRSTRSEAFDPTVPHLTSLHPAFSSASHETLMSDDDEGSTKGNYRRRGNNFSR